MDPFGLVTYFLCLALSRELPPSYPRTVEELLKEPGLSLFAAKGAQVEAKHWTLWASYWPTRAGRLVTQEFHPIETKEQARKLADEVVIYCSEPGSLRPWGDLILWVDTVGSNMAAATPFIEAQGPGAALLRIGPDPNDRSLPLKNPMKITLLFIDKHGRVQRAERHDVIELAHGPLRK